MIQKKISHKNYTILFIRKSNLFKEICQKSTNNYEIASITERTPFLINKPGVRENWTPGFEKPKAK